MREIKFRGWSKKDKCWVCLPHMLNDFISGKHICYFDEENDSGWDIKYMQYTWLKDKNWVEIYEGDIVKKHCDTDYRNNWPFTQAIEIPVYRNYIYEWKWMWFEQVCLDKEPKWYFETGWTGEIEIIWNIYENPTLLN